MCVCIRFYLCVYLSMDTFTVNIISNVTMNMGLTQGAPRDPRRDSRGERSPWLPLETSPESPGDPSRLFKSFYKGFLLLFFILNFGHASQLMGS